jgi:DsbC/DsbD-like thiol-disulfide interchange protein
VRPRSFSVLSLSLLIGATLVGAAAAQPGGPGPAAGDTVAWTVSATDGGAVKPGARVPLVLHAAVRQGWHVYGLNQAPTGPTALRVAVEAGEVAKAEGAPKGSAPIRRRDPAFGVDTEYYADAFTVTAPVRIGRHAAAGPQHIAVSVQFQTCNGDICQPPKTVRLSAPVTVRADG